MVKKKEEVIVENAQEVVEKKVVTPNDIEWMKKLVVILQRMD